jgi:hypothetical protein
MLPAGQPPPTANGDHRRPVTLLPEVWTFAVRPPDWDNWLILTTDIFPRQPVTLLLSKMFGDFIYVEQIGKPHRAKHKKNTIKFWSGDSGRLFLPFVPQFFFDTTHNVWRGPDEPIALTGTPEVTDSLSISFSPPQYGWLPVTIASSSRRCCFDLSNVRDPFPELQIWLMAALRQGFPRLIIDCEGEWIEWHLSAAEGGKVRFVVVRTDMMQTRRSHIEIDVEISRKDLVRSIFRPLAAFWNGKALAQAWHHWSNVLPGEDGRPPKLETWWFEQVLAKAGPT